MHISPLSRKSFSGKLCCSQSGFSTRSSLLLLPQHLHCFVRAAKLAFCCQFTTLTVWAISRGEMPSCLGFEAPQQHEPSAAEMSKKETVASAFLRGLQCQEYEIRSATEAMLEEKYSYRPAEGKFKNEKPEFGPAEVRTFAEQVKHVACANFAFAAELDGQKPPDACDKGGPSPAKSKKELLIYLRDSFAAIRRSLGAIDAKNMFDPIEGPYAGPNTRLGLATVVIWHDADHYGQMTLHLRLNDVVPPASRGKPPALQDNY